LYSTFPSSPITFHIHRRVPLPEAISGSHRTSFFNGSGKAMNHYKTFNFSIQEIITVFINNLIWRLLPDGAATASRGGRRISEDVEFVRYESIHADLVLHSTKTN